MELERNAGLFFKAYGFVARKASEEDEKKLQQPQPPPPPPRRWRQ
jgi:hypothetical protein